jgi:predicted SAM-dependent methyltransferase
MKKKCNKKLFVNIGCGMTPTFGFENFDNSLSLKLSQYPLFSSILYKLRIIGPSQMDYIKFCQNKKIKWADATRHIPLPNDSVSLLYSSHMLEHLDRVEARYFLTEAYRVMMEGGVIRLVLPDLSKFIKLYNQNQDADEFVESTMMCIPNPKTLPQRLRMAFIGNRHHLWMYDGKSLSRLLERSGFKNVQILDVGQTIAKDFGLLDLHERANESVYVEGVKV